jgi:hypothetical protein
MICKALETTVVFGYRRFFWIPIESLRVLIMAEDQISNYYQALSWWIGI